MEKIQHGHGATEHARRACGPPAFGGPDERGQLFEMQAHLHHFVRLHFGQLTSFVPRVARRHRPSITRFQVVERPSPCVLRGSVSPCWIFSMTSVTSRHL